MKNILDENAALEHEKMSNSMIRKANDEVLHDLLEVRTNKARELTAQQLGQIENDIDSQKQNIQV
jgi:hypothetical protein